MSQRAHEVERATVEGRGGGGLGDQQ
jgi:hypothetical protein